MHSFLHEAPPPSENMDMTRAHNRERLPDSIYSDCSAIFCASPKDKEKLTVQEQLAGMHEKRTQFQRAMGELWIGQILAWSPQAKGRIERLWRTLQGRLPVMLKLRVIKTLEEANRFLQEEFIPFFNAKFAVPAQKPPPGESPMKAGRPRFAAGSGARRTGRGGAFPTWGTSPCEG